MPTARSPQLCDGDAPRDWISWQTGSNVEGLAEVNSLRTLQHQVRAPGFEMIQNWRPLDEGTERRERQKFVLSPM